MASTEPGTIRSLLAAPPPFLLFGLLALCFCFDAVLLGPYSLVRLTDGFASAAFLDLREQGRLLLAHGLYGWFPKGVGGTPALALRYAPASLLPLVAAGTPPLLASVLLARVGLMALAGYGAFRLLARRCRVRVPIALLAGALFALDATRHSPNDVFIPLFPLFFVWSEELLMSGQARAARLWRALGLVGLCLVAPPAAALPHFPALHLVLVLVLAPGPREGGLWRRVLGTLAIWVGFALIHAPELSGLASLPGAASLIAAVPGPLETLAAFVSALAACLRDLPALPLFLYCLPALWPTRQGKAAALLAPAILLAAALIAAAGPLAPLARAGLDLSRLATLLPFCLILTCGLGLEALCGRQRLPHLLVGVCAVAVTRLFSSEEELLRNALFFGLALAGLDLLRRRQGATGRSSATELAAGVVLFAFCLAGAGMFVKRSELLEGRIPYAKAFGRHKGLKALAKEDATGQPFRVACLDVLPAIAAIRGLDTVGLLDRPFTPEYRRYVAAVLASQLRENPHTARLLAGERTRLSLDYPDQGPDASALAVHSRRRAAEWDMPLLAAMNVKYLIATKPVRDIEEYADLAFREDQPDHLFRFLGSEAVDAFYSLPLFIYRMREPLERGFLAREAVVLPNREQVFEEMGRQDIAELRRKVFFCAEDLGPELDPLPPPPATPPDQDAVRLVERAPDRLVFEGHAAAPGFLVVSNSFEPRWSARLDGQKTPVLRANGAFQAVRIPSAGPFRIELSFCDPLLVPTSLCALAGVLLVLGLALLPRRPPVAAATALDAPAQPLAEPLRTRPRHLILGAGIVIGLWLAIYILFTILPDTPDRDRALIYTLIVTPPTGLLLALWGGLALRRW